jgi:hypothetical protein
MRRVREVISELFLATAATVALAAWSVAAAPVAADQISCRPPGAHTMAADRAARVYSLNGSVYGCVDATGRRRKLGGTGFCNQSAGNVAPVRLAGAIVAYGLEVCGVDTGSSTVLVRALAGAVRLTDVPASTLPLGPESFVSVVSLVVRRGGAVGWIASVDSIVGGRGQTYEVHRCRGATSSLLDSGAEIRPLSLRLVGTRMSWRDGSATRSGRLS